MVEALRPLDHDLLIEDLRSLESLVPPPPPPHSLPPGAEPVAYLDGGLFPSSWPPGPVTISLVPPGSSPPPTIPAAAPMEIVLPSFDSPRRRAARVLGPVVAALAVAAGLLSLTGRSGLDPGEAKPAAPAAAVVANRLDSASQEGQPRGPMPPDTPREAPTAAPPNSPYLELATPIAGRLPQASLPRVSTSAGLTTPQEAPAEPSSGPEAPTVVAGAEAAESAAITGEAPFDSVAATRAIADAELRAHRCNFDEEPREGATGGEVSVTFAPSGRATTAQVSGPRLSGRLEGSCVARIFRALQVPAFSGEPVTVTKRIRIP